MATPARKRTTRRSTQSDEDEDYSGPCSRLRCKQEGTASGPPQLPPRPRTRSSAAAHGIAESEYSRSKHQQAEAPRVPRRHDVPHASYPPLPPANAITPAVVVSVKAAALGRDILSPLLIPLPDSSTSTATHTGDTPPSVRPRPSLSHGMSLNARTAYESRRKAAKAIAAAAVAGKPVTRSAAAAAAQANDSGGGSSAPAPVATTSIPVSVAFPPCVAPIDEAALCFHPSPHSMVGSGAFGVVYRARYQGQPVAVKVQTLDLAEDDDLDELSTEAVLGSTLHHPGLLSTLGASVYGPLTPCQQGQGQRTRYEVRLVMELMPAGSVHTAFKGKPLSEPVNLLLAASVAEQVAWALDFLHNTCGLLHLDVKGANVLLRLDGPGVVFAKLADFGLTVKRRDAASEEWARDRGTPRFMGPEFWDDSGEDAIGEAADVYALGCMMWELAHEGAEFLIDKSDAQVARAKGRAAMHMPSGTPQLDAFGTLAHRCRSPRPADRPAVRQLALDLMAICDKLRGKLKLQ